MIHFLNPFLEIDKAKLLGTAASSRRLSLFKSWLKRLSWAIPLPRHDSVKRCFDLALSTSTLILLTPLLTGIALMVKLDGGPILFSQTRIGHYGRPFRIWKFRSMRVDAEQQLAALMAQNNKAEGVTFKLDHDPRTTRVGRILRRFSLDELPQFFNVLAGEMSVVGPRPALPREVELYTESDCLRLLAKPGLTCLWQVGERSGGFWEMGDRNKIDFSEQVALDVRYLSQPSLMQDLRIILKTLPAMFLGK